VQCHTVQCHFFNVCSATLCAECLTVCSATQCGGPLSYASICLFLSLAPALVYKACRLRYGGHPDILAVTM